MVSLISIYEIKTAPEILYLMLQQREPIANISHKEMPKFYDHLQFIKSHPYKKWWMIKIDEACIGNAYLTNNDEIGLFILPSYQGKGHGQEALDIILQVTKGRILANIAPANERSQAFFQRNGFKHIQQTYELER